MAQRSSTPQPNRIESIEWGRSRISRTVSGQQTTNRLSAVAHARSRAGAHESNSTVTLRHVARHSDRVAQRDGRNGACRSKNESGHHQHIIVSSIEIIMTQIQYVLRSFDAVDALVAGSPNRLQWTPMKMPLCPCAPFAATHDDSLAALSSSL